MFDIDNEQYILSHIDPAPELLAEMEHDAYQHLLNAKMVAGHLQGRILKMFCKMIKPKHILELGTFTGYSALCWAEGLEDDGHIDTIEINDELEDFIRKYLNQSEYKERVTLHIGDALDIIPSLPNNYDLVFIDANKRLYTEYFDLVLPKVRQGGFIMADNTLWYGKLTQPIQHGDNQTKALIKFNDYIAQDTRVEKVILPMRDGITIMRKL